MNKILLLLILVFLASCSVSTDSQEKEEFWFLSNQDKSATNMAWQGTVKIATSEDGTNWQNVGIFLDHAGVPNLLLTQDNTLIATFQYFDPYEEPMFDVIAFKTSLDNGNTWTDIQKLKIKGLPNLVQNSRGVHLNAAVDPYLVQLENGRLRLYFTYQTINDEYPSMHSAIAESISSEFTYEDGTRLIREGDVLLDPVLVYFEGLWHHYTWTMSEENDQKVEKINVHSISENGLNFEIKENIGSTMNFLGQAIVVNEEIWFYGSGSNSYATSSDGYKFSIPQAIGVPGADPGVARLGDKSFVMIYTTMNTEQITISGQESKNM
jgi:hypothetical protein